MKVVPIVPAADRTESAGKRERRKFNAKDPKYRWRLWLRYETRDGKFLHLFWGNILRLAAGMLLLAWTAIATAIWVHLHIHRKASEVRFVDVVMPWRWTHFRQEVGHYYLRNGNADLIRGSANEALYAFQAAQALNPDDLTARGAVALVRARMGQGPAALADLGAHLPQAVVTNNEAYVRMFFAMADQNHEDELAEETGRAALPPQPDRDRLHHLVVLSAASAAFHRGRYDVTEALIEQWKLRADPEGAGLFARSLWMSGRHAAAEEEIRTFMSRASNPDPGYVALEQMARGENDLAATLRYAELRLIAHPAPAAPAIDVLYAEHALHRTADETKALEDYYRTFRADRMALTQLLQFAVDTAQPRVAERIEQIAAATKDSTLGFDLGLAEAQIAAGDYAGALKLVTRLKTHSEKLGLRFDATVAGLELVAKYGQQDWSGTAPLEDQSGRLKALAPVEAVRFARYLQTLGQPLAACKLLEQVQAVFPQDESVLLELVESEAKAQDRGKLAKHLPALLKARVLPSSVLRLAEAALDPQQDQALAQQVRGQLQIRAAVYLPEPWTPPLP